MFKLISAVTPSSMTDITSHIAQFIESSGGAILNISSNQHTVVTKNGQYLRLSVTISSQCYLKVDFGTGVNGSNELILTETPSSAAYWYCGSVNVYLDIQTLNLWRMDSGGKKQVFVFQAITSDAKRYYWILGDFTNQLTEPESLGFCSFGNYLCDSSSLSEIFPAPYHLSSSTYARGRVHVPLGSTPTQTLKSYTTLSGSNGNGQVALSSASMSELRHCSRTPSAGIPMQPFSLYVQDATGELHMAGFVDGLYFASQSLPDGTIITKGERNFRVCRTYDGANFGAFLMEVSA